MKTHAERQNAESLFVREGRTLDDIAAAVGVSKATLARWSAAGKWTEKRAAFREGPMEFIATLKRERALLAEQVKSAAIAEKAGLIDGMYKLDTMIERAERGAGALDRTMGVMEEFAAFAAQRWPGMTEEKLAALADATQAFLNAKRKENA
ncbi:MAG TPA: phage terminase small subunit-related protein [Vicinamibacterales bacterium]|nr:phage terminase small subunit-related protein [Vicinamibacterales bacterium]